MTTEERAQTAAGYKLRGEYNCCQAVLKVYEDELGAASMSMDALLQLGAGFAGGMGCMEATCGSLIGAAMVAGIKSCGRRTPALSK